MCAQRYQNWMRLVWSLVLIALMGVPVSAAVPGQIVPASGAPQWLERTDGRPVFICGPGDPEGFLYLGTRLPGGTREGGGQEEMIQRLADEGGNVIYMQMIRSHGGDGVADQNPFVDSNPALGVNDDILKQWEDWFVKMDDAGIVIYLFFYDDGACVWGCSPSIVTVPAAEKAFIDAIVARFKHHKNLIWAHAEEYTESFSAARASAFAAAVRAADDNGHVIAGHQLPGLGFDLASDPNFSQFAIQFGNATTNAAALNGAMVTAWTLSAGRYSNNMSEIPFSGLGTGAPARRKLWAMAMGGANVMANGWNLSGPGDPPDSNLNECRWMQRFLEALPLQRLAPANPRASGDTDFVLASDSGPHGATYVLYSDAYVAGLGVTGIPADHYQVRWLNTESGLTVEDTLDVLLGGAATVVRPQGWSTAKEVAVSLQACQDTDTDDVCAATDNCLSVQNSNQADADADGRGDMCDPCPHDAANDLDSDGICGDADKCPNDPANDVDGDHICGDIDKCPSIASADQSDADADGQGNVCDPCPHDSANDADGDGVCGNLDNCPWNSNPNQADADGNGRGDACEGHVLISEVHYDQGSGEQEFVELLSVGGPTEVTGWRLSDQDEPPFVFDQTDARFPCPTPFVLDAGERLVVFQGSGTPQCSGAARRLYLGVEGFLPRTGDDYLLTSADLTCRDYVAFETGPQVDPPPPDCVWHGPNPSNGEVIGRSLSRFDAGVIADTHSGADWEASGMTSTLGPLSPGIANEVFLDTDGDGIINRIDNCPAVANPEQRDLNGDGQGDRCDADDGVILVLAPSRDRVEWLPETGQTSWNRYRGDIHELRTHGQYTQNPATIPGARRDCALFIPGVDDSAVPEPGRTCFTLVTGVVNGLESTLGTDSSGAARPNNNPCP